MHNELTIALQLASIDLAFARAEIAAEGQSSEMLERVAFHLDEVSQRLGAIARSLDSAASEFSFDLVIEAEPAHPTIPGELVNQRLSRRGCQS